MATHSPLAHRKLTRRLRAVFKATAAALKPATYTAHHRGTEEHPVLVGGLPVLNEDGSAKTKTVPVVRPQEHKVNHFRRLKRAWAKYGLDGYNRYLQSVGANALLPQA